MKDGFIKVASARPKVTVANVNANCEEIKKLIDKADSLKVNLLVFPELAITGYTCGDLFFNDTLITEAEKALFSLADFSEGKYPVIILGLPYSFGDKLYNCAAVINNGKILGIVPKTYLPDHNEFCEKRYFQSGDSIPFGMADIKNGEHFPIGSNLKFFNSNMPEYTFGVEICEDLFAPQTVGETLALAGCNVIINPAACDQLVDKTQLCELLVKASSARLNCGYILSSAGYGESTSDLVFAGIAIIAENGEIIAENKAFEDNDLTVTEIDLKLLSGRRKQNTSFNATEKSVPVMFSQELIDTVLTRGVEASPFMPKGVNVAERAEEILKIQSFGLEKRLEHTHAKTAVLGISGGLDSTLALLVTARAMKLLGRPATDITAITMPCFGTTNRTRSNSKKLCDLLGVSFKEINIKDAVTQHFADIEQDENSFDITYENAQARERTQVLMDIANKENGLVIGTGDLSELALGWATYNGDHMSMYGVNSSVPKTLIRHLVKYEADNSDDGLKAVLYDILDTPVSPELLPAKNNGEIAQKTEDLVGPYELHDFFIYHFVKLSESPKKILRLANIAFKDIYDDETIKKWLKVFIRRFFTQQFKRSCMPEGPKITSVSLSPRGDWRMPSDASVELWLKEVE